MCLHMIRCTSQSSKSAADPEITEARLLYVVVENNTPLDYTLQHVRYTHRVSGRKLDSLRGDWLVGFMSWLLFGDLEITTKLTHSADETNPHNCPLKHF